MNRPDLGAHISLADVAEIASRAIPEDAWDNPPLLGIVLAHANGDVRVEGFPLPSRIWDGRHPAEVLEALTLRMRADPIGPPDDPGVAPLGILGCTEGYAAHVPADTPRAEVEAFEEWCETHAIADHPWGCESRETIVIGFDGSLHWVNHLRGHNDHQASSAQHLDDWPSGRLVEALRGFALAVKEAVSS